MTSRPTSLPTRTGWTSSPGMISLARVAEIGNAAMRAGVSRLATGSVNGMPSTSAYRPRRRSMRWPARMSGPFELGEHVRKDVVRRVGAHEDVEVPVVRHERDRVTTRILRLEPRLGAQLALSLKARVQRAGEEREPRARPRRAIHERLRQRRVVVSADEMAGFDRIEDLLEERQRD